MSVCELDIRFSILACPPGHVQNEQSCYRPIKHKIDLYDPRSNQTCARSHWKDQSHHVTITSFSEHSFLVGLALALRYLFTQAPFLYETSFVHISSVLLGNKRNIILCILPNSMPIGPYLGLFKVNDLPDPLASEPKPASTWRWITGENISLFTYWEFGQPDPVIEETASCLYFKPNQPLWNNVNPLFKLPYICESATSGKS